MFFVEIMLMVSYGITGAGDMMGTITDGFV